MKSIYKEVAARLDSAEIVVMPSGRDYEKCVEAVRTELDVDTPDFPDRVYTAKAGGKIWKKVKGKDVPFIVGLEAVRKAGIGFTGTDVLEGQRLESVNRPNLDAFNPISVDIKYQRLGQPMCYFGLLALKDEAEEMKRGIETPAGQYKWPDPAVVTAREELWVKNVIAQGLNIGLTDRVAVSGTVEGEVGWLAPLGADLIETGFTAQRNDLEIIRKICDIYPAAVWAVEQANPSYPPERRYEW